MRIINMIIVHCAYTPPSMDIGAAEIDGWHKERGFTGIGYHFVIRRDGSLEQGRPLEQPGAHVQGHNAHSIGICLVGGKVLSEEDAPCNNFTPEQYGALRALAADLCRRFPGAEVLGHRDVPGVNKTCPCFDVRSWWAGKRLSAGNKKSEEPFYPGIDHFTPAEFGGTSMQRELLRILDDAREAAGVPFVIDKVISDHEVTLRVKLAAREAPRQDHDVRTEGHARENKELRNRVATLERVLSGMITTAGLALQ